MKKIAILSLLLLITGALSAQNPLAKGQGQLNAGIGASFRGIPLYVGYEHGIHKDISVGGTFTFMSYRERFLGLKYSHKIFGFFGFGNYHFNDLLDIPSKYDVYAGVHGGFFLWVSPDAYLGSSSSGPGFGAHVGGRMFFNDNFGLNAELNAGNFVSGATFGVTFKFGAPK